MALVQLEEEDTDDGEEQESDDPDENQGSNGRIHGLDSYGSEGCPNSMRSTATIAAALNILSVIACL